MTISQISQTPARSKYKETYIKKDYQATTC